MPWTDTRGVGGRTKTFMLALMSELSDPHHAAASSFFWTAVRKLEWKDKFPYQREKGRWCNLFLFWNEPKICLRSINKIFLRYVIKILHKEGYFNCQTHSPDCSATCEPQQWNAQIKPIKTLWDNYRKCMHPWFFSSLIVALCLKHNSWDSFHTNSFSVLCTRDDLITI